MNCPHCHEPSLVETMTKGGVLVDVCKNCKGVWLDRGEVFFFSRKPKELEQMLASDETPPVPSSRSCPRCYVDLGEVPFLHQNLKVDRCPECEGYWFDSGELEKALQQDRSYFALETDDINDAFDGDPLAKSGIDPLAAERNENAHLRLQDLASGMLPLPNLWLRSAGMIVLLYGFLGLILLAIAELGYLPMGVAVAIGMGIIVLQFALGPWLMDLSLRWVYKFSWVPIEQLPAHLGEFVTRVCRQRNMKVPWIGLIHDGTPNNFSYGHHPGNMRIVITQGILDILEPEEAEAIVAHEIGHAKNWDMLLMTVVQLVPLMLYFLYRTALRIGNRNEKAGNYTWAVALSAYVLYIVSEYVVLWFARCREYYADRFAGNVTGNPGAMASALVKIGYGLAARGQSQGEGEEEAATDKKGKKKKKAEPVFGIDAIGAMGIFDRKGAVAMVASSAALTLDRSSSSSATATVSSTISKENLKSAMQWDLWNPWAMFYELNSTHPLIAHRLQYLSDQAATMGQEPYVVFDRRKPESYWDDFAVDVAVILLPLLLAAVGLAQRSASPPAWAYSPARPTLPPRRC